MSTPTVPTTITVRHCGRPYEATILGGWRILERRATASCTLMARATWRTKGGRVREEEVQVTDFSSCWAETDARNVEAMRILEALGYSWAPVKNLKGAWDARKAWERGNAAGLAAGRETGRPKPRVTVQDQTGSLGGLARHQGLGVLARGRADHDPGLPEGAGRLAASAREPDGPVRGGH